VAAKNLGREILLTVRAGTHILNAFPDDRSIGEGDPVALDIPLEAVHFYREESSP